VCMKMSEHQRSEERGTRRMAVWLLKRVNV
jgi:hypothetical protein